MQLVAQNFSGQFLDATGTNGAGSTADIFSYGCIDVSKSKLCAMIMNRGTAQYTFSVRFDTTVSTYGQTKINFNASTAGEYQDVITGNTTILLVFSPASKKYTYTSADFTAGRAPTVTDIQSPFTVTYRNNAGQRATDNPSFNVQRKRGELKIIFPASCSYVIDIVGIDGRKVASSKGTGAFARIVNNAFWTGHYFVRLTTPSGTQVKRIIIL
jgi:hypothetical protein